MKPPSASILDPTTLAYNGMVSDLVYHSNKVYFVANSENAIRCFDIRTGEVMTLYSGLSKPQYLTFDKTTK